MRFGTRSIGLFLLAFAAAVTVRAGDGTVHRVPEKVPNSYIVIVADGQDVKALSNDIAAAHAGRVAAVQEHLGTFTVVLPNDTAAEHLARDPRVAYVQEDAILHLMDCRPLSADGSQWALGYLNKLGVKTRFGAGFGLYVNDVQLYVLDTAINTKNPDGTTKADFVGKTISVYDATDPACFGSGDDPYLGKKLWGGPSPDHGGEVASIIVGNVNGVVPQVKTFTSVVVFNTGFCADDTAFNNAADYVIRRQASLQGMGMPGVANLSFGTVGGTDEVLNNVVKQMISTGIFVAAAAGNNSQDACSGSPSVLAPYPGFMSVGATNVSGSVASYSNKGSCVDIWAPGGEDPKVIGNIGVMTCDGPASGTSFAAPAVSGAAILYFSKYRYWTPANVAGQMKYDATVRWNMMNLHIPDGCTYTCTDFNVCTPLFTQ